MPPSQPDHVILKVFRSVKSAKQLTFTYFSIVAFAIITFHFALFDITLDKLERLTTQNRLLHDKQQAEELLRSHFQTQFEIPPFSKAYLNRQDIPDNLTLPKKMKLDQAYEIERGDGSLEDEYYLMYSKIQVNGQEHSLYLLHFDAIYEQSEAEAFQAQSKQLLLSFSLLCISLWVVLSISKHLTSPLAQLTKTLQHRTPQDLSPIPVPEGVSTREVLQLVEQLNQYQNQIHELLERERAFNRYASHELRTPLMVIKGAVSLLGQSNDAQFIEKQRQRLRQASTEMNDFVSTLLSLTREEDISRLSYRTLTPQEVEDCVESHQHLLTGKQVQCQIKMTDSVHIKMPETSFKILLGNLIKNAFACTEHGQVSVKVDSQQIQVIDTGIGLGSTPRGVEGFGLGLLIAHDICRKYDWQLELINNDHGGCTANITLQKPISINPPRVKVGTDAT
ncbi:sensor histidine kinase [Oceanospirillum beijerinckii]|uniref:sensor histidine kinase n=1 Tax=Oceanospirillum beijerinckii TaxID=64976 RepID=UPI000408CD9B|nr:HAMP domain-containing sensor histidine kinase [Oceanospirillum beijerinckii]